MTKIIIKFAIFFVVIVLLQVTVFNHLVLFGVAVPMVFICWLLRLPVTLNVNWVLTCGFVLGMTVDIFSDTLGMNALTCTIAAVLRQPVLRLYFPREEDLTDPEPTMRSLGPAVYLKYLMTMTVIYCTVYFLVEAMSFFDPLRLLMCITGSSILTFVFIAAIDSITGKQREKRL